MGKKRRGPSNRPLSSLHFGSSHALLIDERVLELPTPRSQAPLVSFILRCLGRGDALWLVKHHHCENFGPLSRASYIGGQATVPVHYGDLHEVAY